MKNLKKLISVIIAVIMIVGSFATVSAADYADVESTNSYYKAIQVLSGLGIAKGDTEGNFNPTADVKRSEMVTFICRALDEEDIAAGAAGANFTDVAADHWAAGYIAWGVNRGIINGMGDGTFAPDAPVKYQDAVVMIMRALGYDGLANRPVNGGYPTGYLKLASKHDVLTNAGYDATKAATREIIAQLIANAIEAPVVEVSEYGSEKDGDKYVVCDGTLGTTFKSILTMRKILTKKAYVYETALANESYITDDGLKAKVELGEKDSKDFLTLFVGETDLTNLTAETVELYYVFDEEDLGAYVALAAVSSNATVSKEIANVVDVKTENSDLLIVYKDDAASSEKKEIEISKTATIYINSAIDKSEGAVVAGDNDDFEKLLRDAASIKLTRDRKSDEYSTIFVTKYTDYEVVEEVIAENARIAFADDDLLKLDPEDRGNEKFSYEMYDANGVAISLEDVKEGDVLNILTPAGVAYNTKTLNSMIIYVTSNTVEGAVEEETVKGEKFLIAGEEYAVCDEAKSLVNLGESGKYFITIDGRVCFADASAEISSNFALVSFASHEVKGSGANAVYKVDLLTKDGEIETFELAKKVKVDGAKTGTEAKDVIDALAALTVEKDVYKRLITYKLDADGKIAAIKIADNMDQKATNVSEGKALEKKWDADIAKYGTFNVDGNLILVVDEAKAYYEEKAKVDSKAVYSYKEEYVSIASFEDLTDDEAYPLVIYQTTAEKKAKTFSFAVTTEAIKDSFVNATLAVVVKNATVYDAGTEYAKLALVQAGETKELVVSNEVDGSADVGDIIQYSVDSKGEIAKIVTIAEYKEDGKLFDLKEGVPTEVTEKQKYAFGSGYVVDKAKGTLYFADSISEDEKGKVKYDEEKAEGINVLEGAYTYAKINLVDLNDKYVKASDAIEAIEYFDISAASFAKEVVFAIYKIDEDGDIQDIIVLEDTENGLFAK